MHHGEREYADRPENKQRSLHCSSSGQGRASYSRQVKRASQAEIRDLSLG